MLLDTSIILIIDKEKYRIISTIFNVMLNSNTGELEYEGLNGTRKIGPSYAKSVVYI